MESGDPGSIPGSGRSPGEGKGSPLQCSCLENPTGRGAWRATVHGVARVRQDRATIPPPPWNLEKWYWWAYLRGMNRKQTCGPRRGRRGWEEIGRIALRHADYGVWDRYLGALLCHTGPRMLRSDGWDATGWGTGPGRLRREGYTCLRVCLGLILLYGRNQNNRVN